MKDMDNNMSLFFKSIWEDFNKKTDEMLSISSGRRIAIWGYGYSGWNVEHLLKRCHKIIDMIIDGSGNLNKISHEHPSIISQLDPESWFIITTFDSCKEEKSLEALGFAKNVSYINIRDFYYDEDNRPFSYHHFLEYKYSLDIMGMSINEQFINTDNVDYSPGTIYSLVDITDQFKFQNGDGVFDYGYGKGGALITFWSAGIDKVGGVEINKDLYHVTVDNFTKLGIPIDYLLNKDATEINEELDDYNYIFMYNPFTGRVFDSVIKNIEESYKRKKRNLILIYAAPVMHTVVISGGIFRLIKKIPTDYWYKDAFIYKAFG